MKYYLDTEFDGPRLLSLALVREDGESIYLIYRPGVISDDWVRVNVMPLLNIAPTPYHMIETPAQGAYVLANFFADDVKPHVISDWPIDIAHLCNAILTGPGTMASIHAMTFEFVRVDCYPTTLPGAIQHNAWWDAMALRHRLTEGNS